MSEKRDLFKATLTYKGQSVDMDNPAAGRGLVDQFVNNVYTKEKRMVTETIKNCPKVEFPAIEKLGLSFKKDAVKISFETKPSQDLLRLLHMAAMGTPMSVSFESPQAQFDIKVVEVNVVTGEVKPDCDK